MNQLPFIYEFKTKNATILELQREGLEFLQSLENKKILLLFTVTTKVNPYSFCSAFTRQTDPESNNVHFSYPLSSITISRQIQLIEPDYIMIVMNYCHKTPTSYLLLLYGYLISSMMLFHNEGQLNMKSDVVQLLSELQRIVQSSNYREVEENNLKINDRNSVYQDTDDKDSNNTQYLLNPDFYLLLHSLPRQSTKTTLKNIFKDFSSPSSSSFKQLEKSIEALNYLFHTRRSHHVAPVTNSSQYLKTVEQVRSDIISSVSSKKFLGCEISGSIVKHLACQFIIFHNQGIKSINFNDLQSKFTLDLIESQKQFGITSYVKKLSYRIRSKDLPVSKDHILLVHETSIKQTFEEFSSTVKEDLNIHLDDFIKVWKQILLKCGEHLNYVLDQNQKAILSVNQSLIAELSSINFITENSCQQEMLEPECYQILQNVFDIYMFKSVGSESKESFSQLSNPLINKFLNYYQQTIRDNLKHIHELQTKNLVLTQRNHHLQKQNQILQERIEQCYSEKQVTSYINQSKQSDDNSRQQLLKKKIKYKNSISVLEKQVHDLENKLSQETLKRKTIEEDLLDITQKYEHIVSKQKSKSSKPVTVIGQLSYDLKDSIQTFDRISNRVHKMQGIYKYAKQIVVQNKKLNQQIQKKTSTNKQLEAEHQKLYSNIDTYNSTIGELEWNAECYKSSIKELQMETGVHKVNLAEMDAKIQVYGKCLKLIKVYMKTGRHEQLWNFIKVSQHDDIKSQIQELFS